MAEPFTSAIRKAPMGGPVNVDRQGLDGDQQADLQHHGGPDKALCCYPLDHYATWADELGNGIGGVGSFGENLTLAGVTETTVSIGDVLRAPSGLTLQVTQPRVPCSKLARNWGTQDMAARVVATARSGWYCRVLVNGSLEEGQSLEVVHRPHQPWTVERAHRTYHGLEGDSDQLLELAEIAPLSAETRASVYRKLARQGYVPMACAVHDLIEDAAVRRVPLALELARLDGGTETVRVRIRDWRSEQGAEYVELEGGRLVRLDRVVRVEPVPVGPA